MIDITQAQAYIEALTGSPDTPMTYQTFDDTDQKRGNLTSVLQGTIKQMASTLAFKNEQGAGIFVQVNPGEGGSRLGADVVEIRALFIDDDKNELPPDLVNPKPTWSVQTRNGWHHYWKVKPGMPVSAFETAQTKLIQHFKTDPSIKNLSRVMRLPGFMHMKQPESPFPVAMVVG